MQTLSSSGRWRARRVLVAVAALATAAAGVTLVPQRAAADYQHLPSNSPTTWTYAGTLSALQRASDAAATASSKSSAADKAAAKALADARTALASAQNKDDAAKAAQLRAKAAAANASSSGKSAAQANYDKAIAAREKTVAALASATSAARTRYSAANTAKAAATQAASDATAAKTRVSRYQYMYGSSASTAFTRLRSAYTFTNNGYRPDSSIWKFYDTASTEQPTARDPRYIGVYNNNLEVTSWGQVGSGTCLCAGSALPTTPYGRWEVRAKVNANSDHGVAILLWPNDRTGYASGEIDLAEFNQPRTQANFALHYDEKNLQVQSHILGDFRQWHTYRVDWNSRGVAWYIDNNLFATVTDPAAIPTKPFHLAIQAAPNSSRSGKSSTTVAVSSIKVYAP